MIHHIFHITCILMCC